MKDYKVEMKPTYWEVVLSSGCYSYYKETHLFFAGNDENEIWNFLCTYTDDIITPDIQSPYETSNYIYLKWGDKRHIAKNYKEEENDYISWDSDDYHVGHVSISRLNVIYFNK